MDDCQRDNPSTGALVQSNLTCWKGWQVEAANRESFQGWTKDEAACRAALNAGVK